MGEIAAYLSKSKESLASAKDNLKSKRYNSCANRAYYACYQASVAALTAHGVTPPSKKRRWEHDIVQTQISNLIRRKKVLPAKHRSTLSELMTTRIKADYEEHNVPQRDARRGLKTATEFVSLLCEGIKNDP